MNRVLLVLAALFIAIFSQLVIADNHKKDNEIIFGVLPILSTEKLIGRFGPMANYLSEKIGKPVRLVTAPNFKVFKERTHNKQYDLVFTAPHLYYMAQRQAGYQVIVKVAAPDMKAVIVVPKDSEIKNLSDLKNKKVSITNKVALSTLMIKAHLNKSGINPQKDLQLVYTPTHNASPVSAYKGVTDAASLMLPPYKRSKPELQQAMRILALTDGVPHMPIAVAANLSKDTADKIKTTLIQLKSSKEGKALLKHLRWPGFAAIKSQEYDKLKWAVDELK